MTAVRPYPGVRYVEAQDPMCTHLCGQAGERRESEGEAQASKMEAVASAGSS